MTTQNGRAGAAQHVHIDAGAVDLVLAQQLRSSVPARNDVLGELARGLHDPQDQHAHCDQQRRYAPQYQAHGYSDRGIRVGKDVRLTCDSSNKGSGAACIACMATHLVRHSARQTKVTNREVAVGVDEQVRRLQVSMQHVGAVDVLEATQQLVDKVLQVLVRQSL